MLEKCRNKELKEAWLDVWGSVSQLYFLINILPSSKSILKHHLCKRIEKLSRALQIYADISRENNKS